MLLDVHMPKLDGYEVIKQLKQMPQLRYTPIVFLTGYSTAPDNIESGYNFGGTEYWKKPMATEEFEVRVTRYPENRGGGKNIAGDAGRLHVNDRA